MLCLKQVLCQAPSLHMHTPASQRGGLHRKGEARLVLLEHRLSQWGEVAAGSSQKGLLPKVLPVPPGRVGGGVGGASNWAGPKTIF